MFGAAWMAAAAPAQALLCTPILGCSCSVAASDVAFGPIQPLSASATFATGDLNVHCTGVIDVAPSVLASIGPSAHGPIANRRMLGPGGALLPYNLYTSTSYSSIVGQGAGGFPKITITGSPVVLGGWNTIAHVYGRAPAAPMAVAGNYTDTVTVRIEW